MQSIMRASGNWPNLWRMALRNPIRWWEFIRFPTSGALALVTEGSELHEHVWSLRRYRPRWYHKRFFHDWFLFLPLGLANLLTIAWERFWDTDLSEKGLVQRPQPHELWLDGARRSRARNPGRGLVARSIERMVR